MWIKAKHPQILGTGTEDYVNEAWGLRVAYGLWSGTPVAEGERIGARLTGYRWHIPDPVPFTRSLWAGIEHAGWTYNADGSARSGFEERPDYFSSVAFWYQKDVNEGLPEPPYGEARLPLGNAEQIAVEDSVKEVTTIKGSVAVQREVDWGRDLLFFAAQDKGAQVDVPIDVREAGRYEIIARIAQAPDYGDYTALLDGKPTNPDNRVALTSEIPSSGPQVFHGYLPEILVAVEQPLGWLTLTKGRHVLSFLCVGKDSNSSGYNLGINDVVLERVPQSATAPDAGPHIPPTGPAVTGVPVYRGVPLRNYVHYLARASEADRPAALRAIGAFGGDAAPAVNDVASALSDSEVEVRTAAAWALSQMATGGTSAAPALGRSLSDPDPRVRTLSAVALRAMGPGAAKAIPGLLKALDDSSPSVRAVAADALGNLGPAGKPAVEALSRHLVGANEQVVYVLRSVAAALGNIGSGATSALPALEQALQMHRVKYTAEEAIHKIKGEPVNVW